MPSWKSMFSSQVFVNTMFIKMLGKPLIGEKPLLLRVWLLIWFNDQNLPFKSFKSLLINTCSEPLASQVLTIHFPVEKISVEFTSSENIANNFAVEWRFHTNNYWNAVSQADRVMMFKIAWMNSWRSRIMILNHALINPKRGGLVNRPQPWF